MRGLVDIGATKLYHEVRGSGPALLLISSAAGIAGQWTHLAPTLMREFTVVTYDRRGRVASRPTNHSERFIHRAGSPVTV